MLQTDLLIIAGHSTIKMTVRTFVLARGRKKLRPLEQAFLFARFHYEVITDAELEAKSQVLVIGQYSTGKTTVRCAPVVLYACELVASHECF